MANILLWSRPGCRELCAWANTGTIKCSCDIPVWSRARLCSTGSRIYSTGTGLYTTSTPTGSWGATTIQCGCLASMVSACWGYEPAARPTTVSVHTARYGATTGSRTVLVSIPAAWAGRVWWEFKCSGTGEWAGYKQRAVSSRYSAGLGRRRGAPVKRKKSRRDGAWRGCCE